MLIEQHEHLIWMKMLKRHRWEKSKFSSKVTRSWNPTTEIEKRNDWMNESREGERATYTWYGEYSCKEEKEKARSHDESDKSCRLHWDDLRVDWYWSERWMIIFEKYAAFYTMSREKERETEKDIDVRRTRNVPQCDRLEIETERKREKTGENVIHFDRCYCLIVDDNDQWLSDWLSFEKTLTYAALMIGKTDRHRSHFNRIFRWDVLVNRTSLLIVNEC